MEGVETAGQDAMIRECGCDLIQGYYHYRPMEMDAFYGLMLRGAENIPHKEK